MKSYYVANLIPGSLDSLYILKKDFIPPLPYADFPIVSDLESIATGSDRIATSEPSVSLANASARVSDFTYSGTQSVKLGAGNQYALTTKLAGFTEGDTIRISIWRYPIGGPGGIVIAADRGNHFYEMENERIVATDGDWEQLQLEFYMPALSANIPTAIYLWNPTDSEVWFDDLRIDRLKASNR